MPHVVQAFAPKHQTLQTGTAHCLFLNELHFKRTG